MVGVAVDGLNCNNWRSQMKAKQACKRRVGMRHAKIELYRSRMKSEDAVAAEVAHSKGKISLAG
jgi:hypothetical protein